MELKEFFREHKRVAVGLSGGVDSAFLLNQAKKYAVDVRAYFVNSLFQPAFELEDARRISRECGTGLTILHADVLSEPDIRSNPENRCYYCKNYLFQKIIDAANQDGFDTILDGTNASDDEGSRPGMQALKEKNVLSPLRICGLTKEEIRRQARREGIFVHSKPSYACLATRIPSGVEITDRMIKKVEAGENILFTFGFTDFRIRWFHGAARIQLAESQISLLTEKREEIRKRLVPLFEEVLLDLKSR